MLLLLWLKTPALHCLCLQLPLLTLPQMFRTCHLVVPSVPDQTSSWRATAVPAVLGRELTDEATPIE